MKIKEVMEQTGLTDRAIRLYISNGLIDPQCERSYTGRNNYDFSNEDIELLRKIALLRKADFSLEQIRDLQTGGEEAVAAFNAYLTALRKEHERNEKVLHALQDFPAQVPTIEEVCRRLERSFQEEPTSKAVHDELPPHFHTPSDQTHWFRIWIDMILHPYKLMDRRSKTAHCSRCGALIRPPEAERRYDKVASPLFVVQYVVFCGLRPFQVFSFCLELFLYIACLIIMPLIITALIRSICSWEIVPIYSYGEKRAIELEIEDMKDRRAIDWLYAVFGLILFAVIRVYTA